MLTKEQRRTAAKKANETRRANRYAAQVKARAAYDYRDDMFASMTDEERADMTDKVDAILTEFSQRIEEFEEELLSEAREALSTVVGEYSWDTVKCYTESGNGHTAYPADCDLDHMLDEWKDESAFEYDVDLKARVVTKECTYESDEAREYEKQFIAAVDAEIAAENAADVNHVAVFDARGNFVGVTD